MQSFRSLRLLAVSSLVPALLIYWPMACSNSNGALAPREPAAGSADPTAAQQAPVTSRFSGSLPHPAFAYASSDPSAASIADIAERVTPSVVSIASEREAKEAAHPFFPFMPPGPPQKQQGLGSGVVASADGTILTNHHVVEGATEIKVTTASGEEFQAEVVGTDEKSDLAVLRVKGDAKGLRPLTFGDSAALRLGDIVLAIGNPFGVGQTVTMGIVSAKGRADVGIVAYEDFIQTDAAINPGNSGGALVNMRGELVGINTAILSRSGGYQGIGFAIPSSMVQPIMKSLVEHGRVVRGFLGIGIQDLDAALAKAFGLPDNKGVLVTEVHPGSGAAKAGVARGDVVLEVDGQAVESTGKLRNAIAAKGANTSVKLTLSRKGKRQTLTVQLAELPDSGKVPAGKAEAAEPALGMQLAPLDDKARRQFGMGADQPGKVVVVAVKPGSRAERAGLRAGDVIIELDKRAIGSVEQARTAVAGKDSPILVAISRRGSIRYLVVEP